MAPQKKIYWIKFRRFCSHSIELHLPTQQLGNILTSAAKRNGALSCFSSCYWPKDVAQWDCRGVKNMSRWSGMETNGVQWRVSILFMDPWLTKNSSPKTLWKVNNLILSRMWDQQSIVMGSNFISKQVCIRIPSRKLEWSRLNPKSSRSRCYTSNFPTMPE